MRAVLFSEHGSADVLHYIADHPTPEPKPGEVRLRVRAAALNRLDIWVREGWPGLKLPLPSIPGADAAGDIDALGTGVTGWEVGTPVVIDPMLSCGVCEMCLAGRQNLCRTAGSGIIGEDSSGTYAEYFCVSTRNLYRLPQGFDYGLAAAGSLAYITAWHSLITKAELRPGQTVLIVGAGGGVNSASIEIAKLAGATVYVVGSNAEKIAQAKQLGADVVIDRSAEDWSKAVYKLTNKRGVDVVVDNVGKETIFGSIRSVRDGGKILIVGNTSGPITEIDLRYIFRKQISIIGSTMAPHADFAAVMEQIIAGRLKPIIGARFPLEQAAAAQRALEAGNVFGKIVLDV
jgi:NADPH:quinone reductase-like Zn-dependent oxidoreductase